MKRLLVAETLFLGFALLGITWVSLLRAIPVGTVHTASVFAIGILFVGTFLALLGIRVRRMMLGSVRLWRELVFLLTELTLLLVVFAVLYRDLGIIESERPGRPVVHDFWTSLYFSAVTFTTLGYGDFYPTTPARALAGLQSLTGYVALGILASTAASLISPYSKAGWSEGERE
jgi:hypothetical protein